MNAASGSRHPPLAFERWRAAWWKVGTLTLRRRLVRACEKLAARDREGQRLMKAVRRAVFCLPLLALACFDRHPLAVDHDGGSGAQIE